MVSLCWCHLGRVLNVVSNQTLLLQANTGLKMTLKSNSLLTPTNSLFGNVTSAIHSVTMVMSLVVDRSSASAWWLNVGSCAYSADILLRPNVKIILRPKLWLRTFSVIIFGFGRRWFSYVIHLYILGVASTGNIIHASLPLLILLFCNKTLLWSGVHATWGWHDEIRML